MTEPGIPPAQRPGLTPPEFERDEDFVSLYANNIDYEISAWDLKSSLVNWIKRETAAFSPSIPRWLCLGCRSRL